MYVVNKLFFAGINKTLTPIEASPENHVVITGAASGIGKEMALLYAAKGFSIILIDVNEDGVQRFAAQLKKKYASQTFSTIVIDLSTDTGKFKPHAIKKVKEFEFLQRTISLRKNQTTRKDLEF